MFFKLFKIKVGNRIIQFRLVCIGSIKSQQLNRSTAVIYNFFYERNCFITISLRFATSIHSNPCLIYVGKEPTIRVESRNGHHCGGSSLACKYQIRVEVANTLQCDTSTVMAPKSFIAQASRTQNNAILRSLLIQVNVERMA